MCVYICVCGCLYVRGECVWCVCLCVLICGVWLCVVCVCVWLCMCLCVCACESFVNMDGWTLCVGVDQLICYQG